MLQYNPILDTDSYKYSMFLQYPPKTTNIFSYVESRGGIFDSTLFFGLQIFIKKFLLTRLTKEMVYEAERIVTLHGEPFNTEGWLYIVEQHNGFLPLIIKSVPEGMIIPTKNVLVTVEVTDPKCFWVTTFIETALLRSVWYPTTVATNSYHCKQIIIKALELSGDPALIDFKLHDFGARGVSSYESAAIGGLAHLINFKGTDTVPALIAAIDYYDSKDVVGWSIPAAEHSTITSWGNRYETRAYENMILQFGSTHAMYAVVSDSYDVYNAVENIWGGTLKEQLVKNKSVLVIRPDSGDPTIVLPKIMHLAALKFGFTMNKKGYKIINKVRFIQGDGITINTLQPIIDAILNAGFSLDNIAFGMGGGLLQHVNRDDQKFAMKCSAVLVDGVWIDVFKDPITDPGKKSKKGRLQVVKTLNGQVITFREDEHIKTPSTPLLQTVYQWNGIDKLWSQQPITNFITFEQVRLNSCEFTPT
ncbi:MAG: nicotinate phosphoribosyltransferase [Candidatus Riesia sp.]|nr:nicotinate phosphoribosyltransferase [Candidatus Riesia sp.]